VYFCPAKRAVDRRLTGGKGMSVWKLRCNPVCCSQNFKSADSRQAAALRVGRHAVYRATSASWRAVAGQAKQLTGRWSLHQDK